MGHFRDSVNEDAMLWFEHFDNEMLEQFMEYGEISTDLRNDYHNGDSFIHNYYTDNYFDLNESAQILDELSEFEETDWGLWQGLQPEEAISAKAAYTYSNAVYWRIVEIIEQVNFKLNSNDPEKGFEEMVDYYYYCLESA